MSIDLSKYLALADAIAADLKLADAAVAQAYEAFQAAQSAYTAAIQTRENFLSVNDILTTLKSGMPVSTPSTDTAGI
jgi:hypothetical protein